MPRYMQADQTANLQRSRKSLTEFQNSPGPCRQGGLAISTWPLLFCKYFREYLAYLGCAGRLLESYPLPSLQCLAVGLPLQICSRVWPALPVCQTACKCPGLHWHCRAALHCRKRCAKNYCSYASVTLSVLTAVLLSCCYIRSAKLHLAELQVSMATRKI